MYVDPYDIFDEIANNCLEIKRQLWGLKEKGWTMTEDLMVIKYHVLNAIENLGGKK